MAQMFGWLSRERTRASLSRRDRPLDVRTSVFAQQLVDADRADLPSQKAVGLRLSWRGVGQRVLLAIIE
ncbi:MAG: hypothetical protein DMF53_18395 [Acidobacteria bacterium]|nr:MAG: hypothetical protein DMF53_18395 [Acidobacteriota bacterium]